MLNSLIDLGRNLKIWDLRPKDITVLLNEEVAPDDSWEKPSTTT